MRREMEEEIKAQLMANQAMLEDNSQNWESKVGVSWLGIESSIFQYFY